MSTGVIMSYVMNDYEKGAGCFTHPSVANLSLDTIKLHVIKTTQVGQALNV